MKTWFIVCVTLLMPSLGLADEASTSPRSPAARAALIRHTNEVQRIDEEAAKQKQRASKELVDMLKKVQAEVLKSGNLQEANAIQAEIDRMSPSIGKKPVFQISAARAWQDTVSVKRGQTVVIEAKGVWCATTAQRALNTFGPNGGKNARGQAFGQLVARVGEAPFVSTGSSYELRVEEDGVLQFAMRDSDRSDNDGELTVTLTVRP